MYGQLAPLEPSELDFETIRLAVMETARGRWFLDEYARRNRHAETGVLMTAMQRIENAISEQRETSEIAKFRLDVLEMSRAIARTRDEISVLLPSDGSNGRLTEATGELDSIVSATEKATSDILAAAEKVQEIAWTLREAGTSQDHCEGLDQLATAIYTSCSFQDLTSQRIRKVIETIEFLESRVNAMADIWQVDEEPQAAKSEPVVDPKAGLAIDPSMSQADVDFVLVHAPSPAEQEPVPEASFELDMSFPSGQPLEPLPTSAEDEIILAESSEPPAFESRTLPDSILFDRPEPQPLQKDISGPDLRLVPTTPLDVEEDSAPQDITAEGTHDNGNLRADTLSMSTQDVIQDVAFEEPKEDSPAVSEPAPAGNSVEMALARIRSGSELSFSDAAKALDAIKAMSPEERAKLFHG